MRKAYVIRNIHGGVYSEGIGYYPYLNTPEEFQERRNIKVYDSEQEALDDVSIILSQYMSNENPLIEIVPIYTH